MSEEQMYRYCSGWLSLCSLLCLAAFIGLKWSGVFVFDDFRRWKLSVTFMCPEAHLVSIVFALKTAENGKNACAAKRACHIRTICRAVCRRTCVRSYTNTLLNTCKHTAETPIRETPIRETSIRVQMNSEKSHLTLNTKYFTNELPSYSWINDKNNIFI